MKVKNSWKRVIAGMLAVLVMAATVPAGTDFGGLFGGSSIVASAETAQSAEVTLDFTGEVYWNIPTSNTTNAGTYTDGTSSITLYGTGANGYKLNQGYLMLGKQDAYLELPAFDFDVEKIVVNGRSGASTSVRFNVYVGNNGVSTEATGSTGTQTFEIASNYQAAGNVYKLKINSDHNVQIKTIEVYKKAAVTEWAVGDNINLNGKWFFYNDNDTVRVHGRNSSAVVPTPFYDEYNGQWVFGNSIPADQYSPEPSGVIYTNEHEAGLFIKKPSGKPSTVIPSGFKIKGGSGTQADPYTFELVYPIQTVSSNKPIVVKAGDDFKVDGNVSAVKIGNEDPYSISGGVASGTVFTVSEDTDGLSVAVNDIECSLPFSVNSAKTYLVYYYYGKLAFIENKVYNSELDATDLNIGDVLAPGASFDSVGTFCFQEGNGSYQEYGYGVKFSVAAGGLKQGGTIKNNFADNKNAFVYDHRDSDNDKDYFNQTYVDLGPVVTTAPTAKENLKYNGEAQDLITEGVADGGTMQYGLGEPIEVIGKGGKYVLSGDDLTIGKIIKPSDDEGFLFPTGKKVKLSNDNAEFNPCNNMSNSDTYDHVLVRLLFGTPAFFSANSTVTQFPTGCDALRIDGINGDTIEVTAVKSSECLEVKTWSATPPKGTNAGSYTVFYKAVKDNKSSDVGSVTATIAKADATVTTPSTAKENLKYNGEPQDLITAGTSEDGTVQYAVVETDDDTPEYTLVKRDTDAPLELSDVKVNTIYTPDLEGDNQGNEGVRFSSSTNFKIDDITYTGSIGLFYNPDDSEYYLDTDKGYLPLPEGCDGLLVTDIDSGNVYLEIVNTANPSGDVQIDEQAWVESIPKETDAGKYNVYYRVKGDANHNNTKPVKIENVKIAKANATVTAPTAKTLTYNGKAQELVTEGTTTGGTMQYAIGTKDAATEPYTTSIPKKTNAGTYYVWYKVVGDDNYNDAKPKCVTATIKKAVVTVTANNLSKKWGAKDPDLTYKAAGLVGKDKLTGALTREAGEEVGKYAIKQGTLKANENYTLKFNGAVLTINTAYFKITFVNDDGTVLQSSEVGNGAMPKYTGKTPTKPATAQYTYTFKGWNKTITAVTGAATYTATFSSAKVKYTVTAEKCEGGKVSADKTNVAWGETVTVTPKANDGYIIKGVYLNGKQMAVNDKGKYQFEMPKNNVKVTAVFEKKQFTVTATKPTNGTLTVDKTNVAWGETVTVTPKANDGYVIKGVYLNGKQMAVNDKGKYQFTMPKNNVKVTAVFEKKQSSIVRIFGDTRFATAAAISKKTFTKADTVVLTYGYNYADAIAGVPLASKLNAPILLSNTDSVPSETLAEIKRLGAKKVIILGGTNAISEKAEKQLKAKKLTTQRIVGDTRFSTAVEIAKKINTKPTEVFLVYGYNYADALSVSTVAAIKGAPIVYLPKDGELDADTAAYLKSIKGSVKKAYVIGGKSIISDSVKNKASNALGLKSVQRIAGDDRYLTCLKVNETFKDLFTGSIVCAATGTNFPDALAGGVYAAKNKAPLLLVNTAADDLSKEQLSWLKAKDAKQVTVFGGTNSVSDKHAEKIAKARV